MRLTMYLRERYGEVTEVYPTLAEAMAGVDPEDWQSESTNERGEAVEFITGTGDDEIRVTEKAVEISIAPPGEIGRLDLEVLVDREVGGDAAAWCEQMGVKTDELMEWLAWLASNEFRADTSGRIGFAFQVGFDAGQLRLAEGLGLPGNEQSDWFKSLTPESKLKVMEDARDAASMYGREARALVAKMRAAGNDFWKGRIDEWDEVEDALVEFREGKIDRDELFRQVDAARPKIQPAPDAG